MSTATATRRRPLTRDEARRRLAYNFRRLKDAKGVSSRQIAKQHRLCYRVLMRADNGQTDAAGSLLFNLARALGVSIDELFRPVPKNPA